MFKVYRRVRQPFCHVIKGLVIVLLFSLVAMAAVGCRTLGPNVIQSSQLDYNQALASGVHQELLLNIVRLRYREAPFFLLPGNLTTSFKASGSFGLSGDLDLGGSGRSLSPSTGFGFSNSPTVVYAPLHGKEFVRDLMTPIDPVELFFLDQSGWSIKRVFGLAIERINDLENAPSASGPTPGLKPPGLEAFSGLIDLLSQLQENQAFNYRKDLVTDLISIEFDDQDKHLKEVRRARELLGLEGGKHPLEMEDQDSASHLDRISIRTRSLLGILFYLSHNVEVPVQHRNAGWVTVTRDDGVPFDWSDTPAGRFFKVRYSKQRPRHAFVSVPYKEGYYYIPEEDVETKSTFLLLMYLQSLQAGKSDTVPSPTLTIPVGG